MPETQAWAGRSHDAAAAMFHRANRDASRFSKYANFVAAALRTGSGTIGAARTGLLNKGGQVDAGPLSVTDQWVVLIDPVKMSAEELAALQTFAREEQECINDMLTAVGDADDDTANAVTAAGSEFGFVKPGPSSESLLLPIGQRPEDEVPHPKTPLGMLAQEAIRDGDMSVAVRDVSESVNEHGEEVTTVTMQDGSKQVITRRDAFEWPSKQNFITIEHFDEHGNQVSRTSSWHDLGNDCDYTSVTWPDGSNFTMSMDPTGHRNAGFTTADGRHSGVPVEVIDNISLGASSGLSGLEKHIAHGGGLPMVTDGIVEKAGKAAKFGGPALGVATTVFDIVMADSGREAFIAAFAGAGGVGGGWGGAEFGAFLGLATGPLATIAVPALAGGLEMAGGYGFGKVGAAVGNVLYP